MNRWIAVLVFPLGFEVIQDKPASQEIGKLIQKLGAKDLEERDRARLELIKIGAPAVDAITEATKSKDVEVKARAEFVLGWIERKVVNGAQLKLLPERTEITLGEEGEIGLKLEITNVGKDELNLPEKHGNNWCSFRRVDLLSPSGEELKGKLKSAKL
jgi:hypothetical protein